MRFQIPEREDTLTVEDLRHLTTSLIDDVRKMLRHCTDADVTFVPDDPLANDPAAATGEEVSIAWTLGHIIVHMTASSEESAALAAELARGVPFHGRSRSEVPWTTMKTVAQCRARLEESRRMRLASLDMWPAVPHLSNTYAPREGMREIGPVARFLSGLRHDASHLDQLREVIRQARDHRQRLRRHPRGATRPTRPTRPTASESAAQSPKPVAS
ncbi:MAG: DinB family protein [Nitrososphaerota archaeon]